MAQILPKIRLNAGGEQIGVELFVHAPDLHENEATFLSTDADAGATTLTVESGNKFAANEYLLIGSFGAENAEIVNISNADATTVTSTATVFPHNRGEKITFIPYNQIVPERSTDSGGSYSAITTVDIRADSLETYIQRTGDAATDFYRVRFFNSTSSLHSSYSDSLIATGYAEGTAGQVIRDALQSLGETIDDKIITKEFMFTALKDGRNEADRHPLVEQWSFRTIFDFDAGDVIPGRYQLTLPTNLRDPDTYKNILAVSIGKDKYALIPVDKREMNRWYTGIARGTLNGSITTSSTSIVLTSSGDFDESGVVDIAAEDITEEVDSVDYTTNTENTATLGTVTNISVNHATLRDVWQGASFGLPTEYTVENGVITFSQPFDNNRAGENIWLDYYSEISHANSDGDTLDEPFFHIFVPYLRYRIKMRKNPQMVRENDDDYKAWIQGLNDNAEKEFTGQDMRIHVDVPGGRRSSRFRRR